MGSGVRLATLSDVIHNTNSIANILKVFDGMPLHGRNGFRARLNELIDRDDLADLLRAVVRLDRAVKVLGKSELA